MLNQYEMASLLPETFVPLATLLCGTGHGRASPYLIIMLMLMLVVVMLNVDDVAVAVPNVNCKW